MRESTKLFLMLASLPWLAHASESPELSKHHDEAVHETLYQAHTTDCDIAWTLHKSSWLPGYGLSEQSHCQLPLLQQKPFRTMLLQAVLKDIDSAKEIRNFSWGALRRKDASDEYANRLIHAASAAPEWDKTTGAAKGRYKKHPNDLIKDLLNQQHVFSEVVDVFAQQHIAISVNGVENLIVQPAPTSDGNNEKNKVPVDALISFGLTTSPP